MPIPTIVMEMQTQRRSRWRSVTRRTRLPCLRFVGLRCANQTYGYSFGSPLVSFVDKFFPSCICFCFHLGRFCSQSVSIHQFLQSHQLKRVFQPKLNNLIRLCTFDLFSCELNSVLSTV